MLRRAMVRLAVVLAAVAGLALVVVQTEPSVPPAGPPDAVAARLAKHVAGGLRDLVETQAAEGRWSVTAAELDGTLAAMPRVIDGLTGRARIEPGVAVLDLSLGAPRMPPGLWLNLHLAVDASERGLEVSSARIGRLPLPPSVVIPLVRIAADRALGDRLGTLAVRAVSAVRIDPPQLEVALLLDRPTRAALFDALRDRARALAGGTNRDRVLAHLEWLHAGPRAGYLPKAGSVLPFVRGALARAEEASGAPRGAPDADRREIQAALFALALYCGDDRFEVVAGVGLPERMLWGRNRCNDAMTLGGRDDLKRHFLLSAGLEAASAGGAAVLGLGELKELLDSNDGGSGFSFDDMAANAAGARFARALLAAPRSDWPAMLAALEREAAILPALDGLPRGLGETEFRARYGNVDAPEYQALLAEIDRRVAALPFFGATATN